MTNAMQVFNFDSTEVRVVDVDGSPWWVAKDVCGILEIEKHRDALDRLDDEERAPVLVDTLGGPQSMGAINESGLYSLILRSRKPAAKKFKKWVTSEVLPSIRKTGGYQTQTIAPTSLATHVINEAFTHMTDHLTQLARKNADLEMENERLREKRDCFEILDPHNPFVALLKEKKVTLADFSARAHLTLDKMSDFLVGGAQISMPLGRAGQPVNELDHALRTMQVDPFAFCGEYDRYVSARKAFESEQFMRRYNIGPYSTQR